MSQQSVTYKVSTSCVPSCARLCAPPLAHCSSLNLLLPRDTHTADKIQRWHRGRRASRPVFPLSLGAEMHRAAPGLRHALRPSHPHPLGPPTYSTYLSPPDWSCHPSTPAPLKLQRTQREMSHSHSGR